MTSPIEVADVKQPQFYLDKFMDLKLAVQFGKVPNAYAVDKFAYNGAVPEGVSDSVIWEKSGDYTYDVWGIGAIKYLSSSSALDDGHIISVQGLTDEGSLLTQYGVLDGQNNVELETPLSRVFRMQNVSDEAGAGNLNGMLYCHTSATTTNGVPPNANIRAVINNGNNQTLMAVYTIPKGYVGLLLRGEIGVGLTGNTQTTSEYIVAEYRSRRYKKVFTVKKRVTASVNGNSLYQDERAIPDIIPALTDVQLRVIEASASCTTTGTFDMLVIPQEYFYEWRLKEFGQPEEV